MKKLTAAIIVITMLICLPCLSGCENSTGDITAIIAEMQYHPQAPEEQTHIRIGALVGPYADMVTQIIEPALVSLDYTVEVVIFSEWDATNLALAEGEIDLNLFQHSVFLNNSKYEHNLALSAIAEVPTASLVLLSERYESLEQIENGATIALPGDATNLARALRTLREAGMITLNIHSDITRVTLDDIASNPRELSFNLVDGFGLYREQIAESDAVVMSGGRAYASDVNLSDALYSEVLQDGFMIVAAVRTDDLARRYVCDTLGVIHSEEFKSAIVEEGSPFSGFQRPRSFFMRGDI
ncbi:MAG: MetQ/NlpA family ABC transporter substrate-binding protein [Oscillospiraceae bacterium]|nr:MetQ/NlpA family ABC transporter substrate-binding protein [Oscillospiraceae bacterium]